MEQYAKDIIRDIQIKNPNVNIILPEILMRPQSYQLVKSNSPFLPSAPVHGPPIQVCHPFIETGLLNSKARAIRTEKMQSFTSTRDIQLITSSIDIHYERLKSTQFTVQETIEIICAFRFVLSKFHTISSYTQVLKEHLEKMNVALEKRGSMFIYQSDFLLRLLFTPLELRLIEHTIAKKVRFSFADDLTLAKRLFHNTIIKEHRVHILGNYNRFTTSYHSAYQTLFLAYLPIEDVLDELLFHPEGLYNIVFDPSFDSSNGDWSYFYLLGQTIDGIRKWKNVNRCEKLAEEIIQLLQNHVCDLFRSYYSQHFRTFNYVDDFENHGGPGEGTATYSFYEIPTLLRTALFLTDHGAVRNYLCMRIKERASYVLDKTLDNVNVTSDDPVILRRVQSYVLDAADVTFTIQKLFDDPSGAVIRNVWTKYKHILSTSMPSTKRKLDHSTLE